MIVESPGWSDREAFVSALFPARSRPGGGWHILVRWRITVGLVSTG